MATFFLFAPRLSAETRARVWTRSDADLIRDAARACLNFAARKEASALEDATLEEFSTRYPRFVREGL